jgi:hypothetical protein
MARKASKAVSRPSSGELPPASFARRATGVALAGLGARAPFFGSITETHSQPGNIERVAKGEVDATLAYDANGQWVGYSVIGDDGSTMSYTAS